MQPEKGTILEGKVTGITKFGAFVTMPDRTSGLVHISEIANEYVNDVNDYLKVGQTVRVKVIQITEDGKINLSIKKAAEQPKPAPAPRQPVQSSAPPARSTITSAAQGEVYGQTGDKSFEDKLKQFMQDSDKRISGNKLYAERRGKRRHG